MNDQSKDLPEGRNPSQATPHPKPCFIIRHDQAIAREPNAQAESTRQEEQPDSEGRFKEE